MATTTVAMTCEIAEIEAQLRGRLRGRVTELRVVIRDAGLVLRGSSRTYHAKQLAQHGLMQATTVPLVANEIEVDSGGAVILAQGTPRAPCRGPPQPQR
jgi:hypothetical protein